jgi:hypothetical protein
MLYKFIEYIYIYIQEKKKKNIKKVGEKGKTQ